MVLYISNYSKLRFEVNFEYDKLFNIKSFSIHEAYIFASKALDG